MTTHANLSVFFLAFYNSQNKTSNMLENYLEAQRHSKKFIVHFHCVPTTRFCGNSKIILQNEKALYFLDENLQIIYSL